MPMRLAASIFLLPQEKASSAPTVSNTIADDASTWSPSTVVSTRLRSGWCNECVGDDARKPRRVGGPVDLD